MFYKFNKNIKNNKQKVLTVFTTILFLVVGFTLFLNKPNVVYAINGDVTCSAGEFYAGQGKCKPCEAGYYCPGGNFFGGDSSRDGIYECPSDKTSSAGADSESDCVNVTSVNACYEPDLLRVVYFFNLILDIVKIIVPIGLIVFGIIDFSKAVMSSDEKNHKDTLNVFLKRILYGVLIFAVPWIVEVLMVTLGDLLDKDNMGNFTDCLQNANSNCIEAIESCDVSNSKQYCDIRNSCWYNSSKKQYYWGYLPPKEPNGECKISDWDIDSTKITAADCK